jgi:hypothetical protein
MGDLLVRHPAIGDWTPARDTVLPLLPGSQATPRAESGYETIGAALDAAREHSLGADKPAPVRVSSAPGPA